MLKPVTLTDWCARYSLRRGLGSGSGYFLVRTVVIFETFLGHAATCADLTDDAVSLWVRWMEDRWQIDGEISPRYRHGLRGNLLCLWRFIAEEGECEWPRRIRRAPIPEPQPIAWTLEELRKLRVAALAAKGTLKNGASRSLYLTTLLDSAYESGLRRGDLWRLEQSQFMPHGVIILRQNKTQWPHEPQVQLDTLARIRQLPGKYPLKWPGNSKGFYRCWRLWMIRPSGVRPGVLQQLRRSGATHLESIRPQDTQRYLGHRTAEMKKHYVDRSQAYGPAPQPPKFWW